MAMKKNSRISSDSPIRTSKFDPTLLVKHEPPHQIFFKNLIEVLLSRGAHGEARVGQLGGFAADVFVSSALPWWCFLQSFAFHAVVIAVLWNVSGHWPLRPKIVAMPIFYKAEVIHFRPSEYLPPFDTRGRMAPKIVKGDPKLARQAIISLPRGADKPIQTVITPPEIKLKSNVPLPNVIAWKAVAPMLPIGAVSRRALPPPEVNAIIPPPPTIERVAKREHVLMPATRVIAPPPAVQGYIRRTNDIPAGHSTIVPPAPQVSLSEQRSFHLRVDVAREHPWTSIVPPPPNPAVAELRTRREERPLGEIVPPPPALIGPGHANYRIVALALHPVAGAPPVAFGNRRGTFQLWPDGRPEATGTPEVRNSSRSRGGHGDRGAGGSPYDLPAGLAVKPSSASPPGARGGNSNISVSTDSVTELNRSPRADRAARRAWPSNSAPTAAERQVFGDRKFYSMLLNMPNLNSAGGSWVIRFAELKNSAQDGDLMAPQAIRKVDPGYPLELMRTQVEGNVTLYALIRSDGTVTNVRVLNSVDERLGEFARAALSHWKFQPALKAGSAIDLEAVVTIPFCARREF